MKKLIPFFLAAAIVFGSLFQAEPLKGTDGTNLDGLVRATILVYDTSVGSDFIWTGTTDGSLPPLRTVDGYIHNIDRILPGYIKDRGDLWIEIRIDGRPVTSERIRYSVGSEGLRRETPSEPGEISETLEDELQIGLPGHELYVASATTGFGVDTPVEKVDIDGAVGLKSQITPPTATTDFGKVYVDDADGHLYFMDEGGASTDLLETTSTTGGGSFISSFMTEQLNTCVDKTVYLGVHQDESTGPYTHLWTGDTGPLSATNISNPSFTATSAGIYNLTYTVTDGDGNSSSFRMVVTVHALPTPSITASPAAGGCEGEPVVLSGDGCYEKYCWNPVGPCTKSFNATEGGTYELTVVDEWGCRGTDSYTVSFLPPPVANSGTDYSECYGGTNPTLGGSPAATGGTPPYFYAWTGSGAPYLSSTSVANPTFNVTSASPGVYSLNLEVSDANGCTD